MCGLPFFHIPSSFAVVTRLAQQLQIFRPVSSAAGQRLYMVDRIFNFRKRNTTQTFSFLFLKKLLNVVVSKTPRSVMLSAPANVTDIFNFIGISFTPCASVGAMSFFVSYVPCAMISAVAFFISCIPRAASSAISFFVVCVPRAAIGKVAFLVSFSPRAAHG